MVGDVSVSRTNRIWIGIGAVALISAIALSSISAYDDKDLNKNSGDTNVYLEEEVCFADEIFIKVNSINVFKDETVDGVDEDGDQLSQYTLSLGVSVEQRNTDGWINKVTIKPTNFSLKSVNLEAKSKMEVFFECLAKETLAIMISTGVEGSINIIEETINYIADYTTASIENAENNSVDFKPIKCKKDAFKKFKPRKFEGPVNMDLNFPIKQEYLESNNLIVLSIDKINRFEKRIFLTTRPEAIK